MKTFESYNLRYAGTATQFSAKTIEEVKAEWLNRIREMHARTDISEENRTYWLDALSKAKIVQRIVIESEVV